MEGQSIFERIGSEYYSFTPSEKKLADHILSLQSQAARLSISGLASACGVADATVSRFCRRLGCQDYQDFRLRLSHSMARLPEDNPLSGEITAEDTLEDVSAKLLAADTTAIAQTRDVLDLEAVRMSAQLLRGAGKVLCMGQGGSMLIASEAAHLFSTVDGKFWPVSDSHMQAIAASSMEPGDVVLFFSYSGSTVDMMDTLSIAREREGRVILVTRFPNSPGAQMADQVLQCGANENPLQSGSVAARIAQMYLLDVLFSEYTRRELTRAREMRNRVARALTPKHLS